MRQIEGTVKSAKMAKTAVVAVERKKVSRLYKKSIESIRKYHVHDEIGVKAGDRVAITQSRPISKTKRWKIVKVIK